MTMQDTDHLRSIEENSPDVSALVEEQTDCVIGAVSLSRLSGPLGVLDAVGPRESVDIYFVNSGFLRDPSGALVPAAEAVVVVPGGQGLPMPFAGDGTALRIRIQRATAETFVPHALDSLTVSLVPSRLDSAAAAFVAAIIGQPSRDGSAIESYATEQILLELTGSLLLDHCGISWSSNTLTSVLRDEAMAVIAQRCADRELNPEAVAKAVQSSLRRVQAAFAEVGNSIAAEIRRQRGRLAKNLLKDARYDVLSVQQIAEQTGFGTTAALRRALDELYGCGPKDLRERRAK